MQTTWNTYAHLYPDKGRQIAFGLQEVKATGLTANKTAEDQVIGLLGEIQKALPNYNTYETDDIILWDCEYKIKKVVDRKQFDDMVYGTIEPEEAFVIMMSEGYYEVGYQICFLFFQLWNANKIPLILEKGVIWVSLGHKKFWEPA